MQQIFSVFLPKNGHVTNIFAFLAKNWSCDKYVTSSAIYFHVTNIFAFSAKNWCEKYFYFLWKKLGGLTNIFASSTKYWDHPDNNIEMHLEKSKVIALSILNIKLLLTICGKRITRGLGILKT